MRLTIHKIKAKKLGDYMNPGCGRLLSIFFIHASYDLCNNACPAGLMRGAYASSIIAMKTFIKQNEVFEKCVVIKKAYLSVY
jgi:hypothetical protein